MIKDSIVRLLTEHGIDLFGVIPWSNCKIASEYILRRRAGERFTPRSVIIFAAPYNVERNSIEPHSGAVDPGRRNLSRYAVPRDYHALFRELFERIEPLFKAELGGEFYGFSDNSPIYEKSAAIDCGMGVGGDNSLLITHKYGSYVFLGELITDADLFGGADGAAFEMNEADRECLHCGGCAAVCPTKIIGGGGKTCLSAVTQKKGELDESEIALIRGNGSVWGCDLCQDCCPMNKSAAETPIAYFREDRIVCLTPEILAAMPPEEFAKRAYSWRGRATVERNVKLLK